MRSITFFLLIICIALTTLPACINNEDESLYMPPESFNLKFNKLAATWDEWIPLGNGMLGALVWQKDGKLRISLDRADLWDLRPMENFSKPEWRYSWVKEQWEKNQYSKVQEMFDAPYDRDPAPSKIPGAALEFNTGRLGNVVSVELKLKDAICEIRWDKGAVLQLFIDAELCSGWYRFTGITGDMTPVVVPPAYYIPDGPGDVKPVTGQDLRRLGYQPGCVKQSDSTITYDQQGWGGFSYQVSTRYRIKSDTATGCWSINSSFPGWEPQQPAEETTEAAMERGFDDDLRSHTGWWKYFWSCSAISVPDTLLNRQWYLEMYKFGSAARTGAPPISLQAVWTADDGRLPPWKGDFHHDLNTQLSYWAAYSSNHINLEQGFIDWLEENKSAFERYTSTYYQSPGLNVPGVTTLTGEPMGGWIQYSFGPAVSAWLGQHFYLHWRYTMDRDFLEREAYPWISKVALFLESISVKDSTGKRKFPISSSPEIFNNSRQAWFPVMTNFDLALTRWTFMKASELAGELGKKEEADKWNSLLSEWPGLDIDPETGFTYAPGFPYNQSHRHFSHLMAIHPLGITDWSNGQEEQDVIKKSIATLDRVGPDGWCGYSWSWLGNLKARAFDGKGAAEALRIFAADFCLPNSFHVNGDQSGTGKSKRTYRPFTLEGNFAFAAGLQEMLIQNHTGIVRLFPAIPLEWKDASFSKLRTEGAFLVSAGMKEGRVDKVEILAERGGTIKLADPFGGRKFRCSTKFSVSEGIIKIVTSEGQKIILKR